MGALFWQPSPWKMLNTVLFICRVSELVDSEQ